MCMWRNIHSDFRPQGRRHQKSMTVLSMTIRKRTDIYTHFLFQISTWISISCFCNRPIEIWTEVVSKCFERNSHPTSNQISYSSSHGWLLWNICSQLQCCRQSQFTCFSIHLTIPPRMRKSEVIAIVHSLASEPDSSTRRSCLVIWSIAPIAGHTGYRVSN